MFRAIFICFPLIAFVFVMLGFVFPSCRALQLRSRTQAAWSVLVLLACSKFLFYRLLGGDEFNPDLPMAVIWLWNWMYSGAMILLVLAVALFFLRRKVKAYLLPVLAWSLAAIGIWNGVKVPDVRVVEVDCPALPASLDGYRKQGDAYYQEHPVLYLNTPTQNYRVELFAGYLTDADSSTYTVSFPDTSSFLLYCQEMKAQSNFKSDVEIQAGDRIVTLSTCAYDWYDARYVVQGKLVPLGVANPAETVIAAAQSGN